MNFKTVVLFFCFTISYARLIPSFHDGENQVVHIEQSASPLLHPKPKGILVLIPTHHDAQQNQESAEQESDHEPEAESEPNPKHEPKSIELPPKLTLILKDNREKSAQNNPSRPEHKSQLHESQNSDSNPNGRENGAYYKVTHENTVDKTDPEMEKHVTVHEEVRIKPNGVNEAEIPIYNHGVILESHNEEEVPYPNIPVALPDFHTQLHQDHQRKQQELHEQQQNLQQQIHFNEQQIGRQQQQLQIQLEQQQQRQIEHEQQHQLQFQQQQQQLNAQHQIQFQPRPLFQGQVGPAPFQPPFFVQPAPVGFRPFGKI